jgi:hypothetical protein
VERTFEVSHSRFAWAVRPIQRRELPKKLKLFLLLLGEKAGMREDVKPLLKFVLFTVSPSQATVTDGRRPSARELAGEPPALGFNAVYG